MQTDKALPITGGRNFRELGGYQTMDGQHVRTHKLIRSGALNQLLPEDMQFLSDYGLRYDIDFRSKDEVTPRPDRVPAGAEYLWLPTFTAMPNSKQSEDAATVKDAGNDDARFVIQNLKDAPADMGYQRMLNVYQGLITAESAREAYRGFFATVLKNTAADQSVIFHCSAGKDRTGIAAFLLLSALGVDQATITADYLISNDFGQARVDRRQQELRDAGAGDNVLRVVHDRMTVQPAYLEHARQLIKTNWGDTTRYLNEWLGIDDAMIAQLKQTYLD